MPMCSLFGTNVIGPLQISDRYYVEKIKSSENLKYTTGREK